MAYFKDFIKDTEEKKETKEPKREPSKEEEQYIIKKEEYIEKKEKRKITKHKDKKFITDKITDKQGLISKLFEIMNTHYDNIPMDSLRGTVLHYDLLAHRKELKKRSKIR